MECLSKEAFKKLFLLCIIGEFVDGPYGKMRLEKICYFIQKELSIKPFEFKRYHYGQYSESLSDTLEQLITLGYVNSLPLKETGNKYVLADKATYEVYRGILNTFDKGIIPQINSVIKKWGYKTEEEIIKYAYGLPEMKGADEEETIMPEKIKDAIEIRGLDDEACRELELSLDPIFWVGLDIIADGIENSTLDISKVKTIKDVF